MTKKVQVSKVEETRRETQNQRWKDGLKDVFSYQGLNVQ